MAGLTSFAVAALTSQNHPTSLSVPTETDSPFGSALTSEAPTGLVGTDGVVRDLDVAAISRLPKRERKTLLFVARAARRPPAGFPHVMPCKGRAAATILDLETRVQGPTHAALIILCKDADDDKRFWKARHHARQLAVMVDACNGSQRGAHIRHSHSNHCTRAVMVLGGRVQWIAQRWCVKNPRIRKPTLSGPSRRQS